MKRRRLRSETVPLLLELEKGTHALDVTLAYDEHHHLHEISFVGRGKIGEGLDLLLQDLSIKLSRAIQGRNPDTGAAPAEPPRSGPPTARGTLALVTA